MSRTAAIRPVFAILAVVFFATPIAARMLGITAESFENRPFAEAPKLSQGWDAFGQTTRFLTDRMPLRAQAVRANTRIWTDVFETTPRYGPATGLAQDGTLSLTGAPKEAEATTPAAADTAAQVLRGRDGWLFLQGEMDRSCAPYMPFEEAIERWRALIETIRAQGARALLVIPPDKGTIYPEHLADFPVKDCAAKGKREQWRMIERAERGRDVIGLRDDLMRMKPDAGDDLYARKDSHWSTVGSLSLVRAVLERLDGARLLRSEIIDPGPTEYTGDLTNLLGAPEADMQAQRGIERKPGAPRIPGRTLMIGDSYSQGPVPQLTHYFDDFRVLLWETPPAELARAIRNADTVVVETVEREVAFRAGEVVPALQRELAGG